MVDLSDNQLLVIRKILVPFPYTFCVFGSRSKHTARVLSDLDLVYFEPMSWKDLALLEEAFEESNLPFLVDLVDWHRCDKTFQEEIKKNLKLIHRGHQAIPLLDDVPIIP